MDQALEDYKAIKQHAHYANLSPVNSNLLIRFENPKLKNDTYFVYGYYMKNG